MAAPTSQTLPKPPNPSKPWVWWKIGLSVIALWHIAALLCEPLRMFSQSAVRPMGEDIALLKRCVGPYMEALYLDHGYFFFAPNPGPSHLLRCEIRDSHADPKSEAKEVVLLPDRTRHWPRLEYHRHFMLSEFYNAIYAPTDQPPAAVNNPGIMDQWQRDLRLYRMLQQSIEHRLDRDYPGGQFNLIRLERQLPNEYRIFVEGWKIDDPRLVEPLSEAILLPSPKP